MSNFNLFNNFNFSFTPTNYSTNFSKNYSNSNSSLFSSKFKSSLKGFGQNIANVAKSYLGYNEANGSYKLFTNGRNEAWCADFVTYVVKKSAKESGKKLPSGFGSSSVSGLRKWATENNCYLQTSNKANKSSLIAQNVKKGDIAIFKENGKSHTGIVDRVENGKIYTIEGNTSDKVAQRSYSINNNNISGFALIA
jgi:hypothetical protein